MASSDNRQSVLSKHVVSGQPCLCLGYRDHVYCMPSTICWDYLVLFNGHDYDIGLTQLLSVDSVK